MWFSNTFNCDSELRHSTASRQMFMLNSWVEKKYDQRACAYINVWHNSVHSLNFASKHNVVLRSAARFAGKKNIKCFILIIIIIIILKCKPIYIFEELSGMFADVSTKHGNSPLREKTYLSIYSNVCFPHSVCSLSICGKEEIASPRLDYCL